MTFSNTPNSTNKIIPDIILEEAKVALSHYPDLKDVTIEFKFMSSSKKSFMKAQPRFSTIFRSRNNREYIILMSESFTIENKTLHLKDIPKNVLIGWLGHELGHIMDYRERSSFNLLMFGIGYLFSGNYIRKAERVADSFAVQYGMKDYILATKDFILNHTELSEKYKARIKRLYVSPDEILTIVQEQENK